jgi:hypothetical protein
MRILRNYVKVKFDPNDKIGSFYLPNEEYISSPIKVRTGIVEFVPDRLDSPTEEYHNLVGINRNEVEEATAKELATCLEFDFPMILQVGDRVWWKYNARNDDYYAQELIKYDSIIVALRGEEIIPLQGYVIAEPVKKATEKNGLALAHSNENEPNQAIIKHIGLPCKRYKYFPNYRDSDELKVGYKIWHNASTGIPLEYSLTAKLNKPYIYLQRKDVLKYVATNP